MSNLVLDKYVLVNNKKLRCGYTTGSCAAAAAKAAAWMLFTQQHLTSVGLTVPKGLHLEIPLEDIQLAAEQASCAVRKDGGDDYDVTHGTLIYATVSFNNLGSVQLFGGSGVGRVTLPGLSCPVGEAAINPVPKRMIITEIERVLHEHGDTRGLDITISVPEGEQIAQKTFNSRLGIMGGISILGTYGAMLINLGERTEPQLYPTPGPLQSVAISANRKFLAGIETPAQTESGKIIGEYRLHIWEIEPNK